MVLGGSSINLIYGHGDFDQQATAGTTLCLWAYGAGLFPMAIVLILAPAFYAQNDYKTPTRASVISIAVNLFLNFVMVAVFGLGAASVAFATSVSAWVNMFILGTKLERSSGYHTSRQLKLNFWKIGLASILAAFAVMLFSPFALAENSTWMLLNGYIPDWPRGTLLQGKVLLTQTVIFFGSLAAVSYMLGADDLLNIHKSNVPHPNLPN